MSERYLYRGIKRFTDVLGGIVGLIVFSRLLSGLRLELS